MNLYTHLLTPLSGSTCGDTFSKLINALCEILFLFSPADHPLTSAYMVAILNDLVFYAFGCENTQLNRFC